MKAIKFFTLILLGAAMMACGRHGSGSGSTGKAPKPVYHYVEPEENMAELVWTALKTQHPKVKPVYDFAVDLDFFDEDEITNLETKTHMKYDYFVPRGTEEPDNLLVAVYELSCYETFDSTWVAIVTKNAYGYELDEEYAGKEIFAVEYKDGTVTDLDVEDLLPESFELAEDYFSNNYYECLLFYNDAFVFSTDCYWPIRYNWNGEDFEQDPESVVMENAVDNFHGFFRVKGAGGLSLGREPQGLDANNDFVRDGEVLAHFFVEDGKITGYTLEDPICGFAQLEDTQDGVFTIASKPVAIGYPIENVLDYKKKPLSIKDTTATAGYRDGQYVITQQLMHNNLERFDIFIEFTAEDEDSDIETIHVYTIPIVVTLESEIEGDQDIDAHVKSLFHAIPFDDSELGEFYYVSGYENGFSAYYKADIDEVRFQTYPVDGGGTLMFLAQLPSEGFGTQYQCWLEQDGSLTKVDYELPYPEPEDFPAWGRNYDFTIPSSGYKLRFTNEGIEYYTLSERNDGYSDRDEDGSYINPQFYTVTYTWNGTEFVLKEETYPY